MHRTEVTPLSGPFDDVRWDRLGPGAAVQGGRWLRSMISRLPGEPVTVRHEGPDGALAFTGAVVRDGDAYEAYNPWAILRRRDPVFPEAECSVRRVLPRLGDGPEEILPGLLLVAPGYLGDPVGPAADRPASVRHCLTDVCSWARGAGLATVSVLYTTPAASRALAPAVGALGGESFELTTRSMMPVTWDDEESLAAGRSKRRRIEVQRQLRRLAEHGCVVGTGDPDELFDEVVEARCTLLRWYGQPADEAAERRRLRTLIDSFGKDLLLCTAHLDNRLIAHALFVSDMRTLQNVYVGTTEAGRNAPYAHLAVTYHEPMRRTARERHDWIDYGVGHGDTKRLQGCDAVPLTGHVIPL
ncbi:GNAT family N-acetyltransferase [Streptomyces sp. SID161]|uniref:GNAT family N-acetyltransferase n=1 Tax=Streptomyces sp. SID161 TaxID=2690251 RepID=UPI001370ED96|nr:GNAT family N-acetyltransferase [Streptomyces sp. SID161]MYW47278.1 GNAT family N-acetyltransferase [Streptomyces sp. SID161]